MPETATAVQFEISNSVGRKSKGAVNEVDDIETVQDMLRLAAMIDSDPRLDPGAIDGTIDADESNDDTVKAIEAFQARFVTKPDGLIDVGKRTWRELVDVIDGDEAESSDPTEFFFPFTQLPTQNWTEDIRRFGASRSKGKRAHAGCDLYMPAGTIIHAITSGKVLNNPEYFYDGTYELQIDHGTFIARYGEIQKQALVRAGDHVSPGQPIAKVGDLLSMKISMLHLELYDKSAQGPLTVKSSQTKKTANGTPFWRRKDLIDPTPKLNQWKNRLA